jgi:hypothetical protein
MELPPLGLVVTLDALGTFYYHYSGAGQLGRNCSSHNAMAANAQFCLFNSYSGDHSLESFTASYCLVVVSSDYFDMWDSCDQNFSVDGDLSRKVPVARRACHSITSLIRVVAFAGTSQWHGISLYKPDFFSTSIISVQLAAIAFAAMQAHDGLFGWTNIQHNERRHIRSYYPFIAVHDVLTILTSRFSDSGFNQKNRGIRLVPSSKIAIATKVQFGVHRPTCRTRSRAPAETISTSSKVSIGVTSGMRIMVLRW